MYPFLKNMFFWGDHIYQLMNIIKSNLNRQVPWMFHAKYRCIVLYTKKIISDFPKFPFLLPPPAPYNLPDYWFVEVKIFFRYSLERTMFRIKIEITKSGRAETI